MVIRVELHTGKPATSVDIEKIIHHYFPGFYLADTDESNPDAITNTYNDTTGKKVFKVIIYEGQNRVSIQVVDERPDIPAKLHNHMNTIELALRNGWSLVRAAGTRARSKENSQSVIILLTDRLVIPEHLDALEQEFLKGFSHSELDSIELEDEDSGGKTIMKEYSKGAVKVRVSAFILDSEHSEIGHEDANIIVVTSNSPQFLESFKQGRRSFIERLDELVRAVRARRGTEASRAASAAFGAGRTTPSPAPGKRRAGS